MRGSQQTFSVLHTLPLSECSTLVRTRAGSADSPAIGHEPRVPCRLSGGARLTGDRPEQADGLTRAPGDGEGEATIVEQCPPGGTIGRADEAQGTRRKARRSERRLERLAGDRLGRAKRVGADAHHDRIARAQHAGSIGEDVGPSLEDESTIPSGALRASTDHASCSMSWTGSSRRSGDSAHDRRPATMSARILSVRINRVVERPAAFADATSRALASRIGAPVVSSARCCAKRSKNSVICSSVQRLSAPNAEAAGVTASVAVACAEDGMCRRLPVSCTTSS